MEKKLMFILALACFILPCMGASKKKQKKTNTIKTEKIEETDKTESTDTTQPIENTESAEIPLVIVNEIKEQKSVYTYKKLVVDKPSLENFDKANEWIADFVQGQLTSDFQTYSECTVIDRLAVDSIIAEQKRKEEMDYANNKESSVEYATLVNADYLLKVDITKTGNNYALRCSLQDVKTSSAVSGVAYSETNITEAQLADGSSIHKATYDLLLAMGIDKTYLSVLEEARETKDTTVEANYNIAKGLQAQDEGNYFQALIFFQKAISENANLEEGSQRLSQLTTSLSTGNIRDKMLSEIALRNEWAKIWDDFRTYVLENGMLLLYNPTDINFDKINYERKEVLINTNFYFILNPECIDLHKKLCKAYPGGKKWGIETNLLSFFHDLTNKDRERDFGFVTFELVDGHNKILATSKFYVFAQYPLAPYYLYAWEEGKVFMGSYVNNIGNRYNLTEEMKKQKTSLIVKVSDFTENMRINVKATDNRINIEQQGFR